MPVKQFARAKRRWPLPVVPASTAPRVARQPCPNENNTTSLHSVLQLLAVRPDHEIIALTARDFPALRRDPMPRQSLGQPR